MDDALVPILTLRMNKNFLVLILVLMDDALVHGCFRSGWFGFMVLILVLMDDALVHLVAYRAVAYDGGPNPCFNG